MGDSLPVVPLDLEPFRMGSTTDREKVARQLDDACRGSGFLVLSGHGVDPAVCRSALAAFQEFFDRPLAEKLESVVPDDSANRGYSAVGKEGLAYSLGDESPTDLFEAFNVGRDDTVGEYYDTHRSFYAPNRWPGMPSDLRDAWWEYECELDQLANTLLQVMALALDLPETWFVDRCRRAIVTTRALNYQRSANAPDPAPGQMRMGAHSDYGILTLLLADDVAGLQVFREGSWHDVATPPGVFIGNIGDMLARWTNDRWTSTLHRVVPPPPSVAGPVRRRSIARFLDCEPDLVVECIESCTGPGDPPRYEPVLAGEWLRAKVLRGRARTAAPLPAITSPAVSSSGVAS